MTTAYESVILLSRALDQAGDAIAAVHEDQLADPTPCGDWDVGRLVSHLVAGPRHFLETVSGGTPDWSGEPPRVLYAAATFRSAADDLIHHWHQLGEDAEASRVDLETAEFAVHTWDLVRATGQHRELDPDVAERGLAFLSGALTDENRGDAFRPARSAPTDADAYVRLAAFAGRAVN